MWFFNKKKKFQNASPPPLYNTPSSATFTSIICIPGPWKDIEEVIESVFVSSDGAFMIAGEILFNPTLDCHYSIEICERDERMGVAFEWAGRLTNVGSNFLNLIENHQSVIYISGVTGNLPDAKNIALAASALLKAGGFGVKVETAGKAFEPYTWNQYLENLEESNLYPMFVVDNLLNKDDSVMSCGMQNLGLPDTTVHGESFEDAVQLIKIFNYFQIVDKPIINENETFQQAINKPRYRITKETNPPYEGDELFSNPYGMWKLIRA